MRLAAVFVCIFMLAARPLFAADFPVPGRVSVINLSDDHCIPCKMMGQLVKKIQNEYGDKIATVTINALEERDVARRHAVKTLPTLLFFNSRGEEVSRHVGVMDEASMRKIIDELLAE